MEGEGYRQVVLNYFSSSHIDRVTDRRRDEAWLAAQLADEETRFIPVWKQKNLFTQGPAIKPVLLSPREVHDLIPAAESSTLLGVQGGRTYFVLALPDAEDAAPDGLAALGEFRDLRGMAPLLDAPEGALLAYARAMAYWHSRHRFCGDCGSPTRGAEGDTLRVCTNPPCGQHHFPRTDPAVIVLVTYGERCLLGRKSMWPEHMHSCVSGFVEPGETLEEAVIREVREETGVEIRSMCYHSSQPWPFTSSLMLGFTAEAANEDIRVDREELEKAHWFAREEIQRGLEAGTLRLPMPISVSFRLIEEWFDAGGGRLRDLYADYSV